MSKARVAVLVRVYFWDDFAFRSALQIWSRCHELDVFVLADETRSGPLDVRPFCKLGHTVQDFEKLGLPCIAPPNTAPLWWNCDYGLYDAVLKLPEYDYFYIVESDVVVNLSLRPMIEEAIANGHDCIVPFGLREMRDWIWSPTCVDLPYTRRAWAPISLLLISRRAAEYLLSERRKLGRLHKEGKLTQWAFCEGFFGSALLDAGYQVGSAHDFADLSKFGSIAIFLETDPRTRTPGSICHSVLDRNRYWSKFAERGFMNLRRSGNFEEVRRARDGLVSTGHTRFQGWRLSVAPGNFALDRPARQSSVSRWSIPLPHAKYSDPIAHDAAGGNCGVLSGNFSFHTDLDDHPWWEVDLQDLRLVDEVRIFNSLVCPERARRVSVHVSTDNVNWTAVFKKTDDLVFAGVDDPLLCRLAHPISTRHVRVVLDGHAPLHLSGVEVYGPAVPGPGLGSLTQSV